MRFTTGLSYDGTTDRLTIGLVPPGYRIPPTGVPSLIWKGEKGQVLGFVTQHGGNELIAVVISAAKARWVPPAAIKNLGKEPAKCWMQDEDDRLWYPFFPRADRLKRERDRIDIEVSEGLNVSLPVASSGRFLGVIVHDASSSLIEEFRALL